MTNILVLSHVAILSYPLRVIENTNILILFLLRLHCCFEILTGRNRFSSSITPSINKEENSNGKALFFILGKINKESINYILKVFRNVIWWWRRWVNMAG